MYRDQKIFVISWCVLFIVHLGACAFLSSWNHLFFLNIKIQLLKSWDDDDKTWAKSLKFAADLVILFADFHSIRSLAEFIHFEEDFFFFCGLTSSCLHLQVHCCKQYYQFLYVYFKSKWVCLYKIKNNKKNCSNEKASRRAEWKS